MWYKIHLNLRYLNKIIHIFINKFKGFEQIFCLLDKYELRTIGVDENDYKKLC